MADGAAADHVGSGFLPRYAAVAAFAGEERVTGSVSPFERGGFADDEVAILEAAYHEAVETLGMKRKLTEADRERIAKAIINRAKMGPLDRRRLVAAAVMFFSI